MTRWFDPSLQNIVIGDANVPLDGTETTLISQAGSVREVAIGSIPGVSTHVSFGNGAPNDVNGSNGDFYFRLDGTQAGNTIIYHKESGTWVAALTGPVAYYNG